MVTARLGRSSNSLPRIALFNYLTIIFLVLSLAVVRAQTPLATSQAHQPGTSQGAAKPETKASNDEIVSHDSPASFKVRVDFVLVRVVVRDAQGKVVPNLKKEDFQLSDNRKPQVISSFAVETPASHVPTVKVDTEKDVSEGTPVKAAELPQRFVALFFDDLHLAVQDVMFSRQAAAKLLATIQPAERIAVYTTSGQVEQDFTPDRQKLEEALQKIGPRGVTSHSATDCPPMSLYEAYQIIEAHDSVALQVATVDAIGCGGSPSAAPLIAQSSAQRELGVGESELQFSFANLGSLMRRMSALPGERVIVMVSPGFFMTPSMHESSEMIDRATKANIVINTIDARGLYVSSADVDLETHRCAVPECQSFIRTEELLQDDVLVELADGSGGLFIHNRNDIDRGLLQVAAEPEVSYVLGFTPQNLKLDGRYHHLKVAFTNKEKWNLQARHGYFAPRGSANPEAVAKEEIQQALFSQEEMHELPIECQTQFFKSGNGVRLTVVAHVETYGLKFRKSEDRNNDELTVATVVFDENGNLLTGLEKVVDLRLKDATLDRVNKTGLSVRSSFDLQPGTFLVRIVVRDSEGAQMAAMNRGVVIP
jgi:VWFA-related protein